MAFWSKVQRSRERRREDALARRNRSKATECFYCGVAFEETGPQERTVDHRLARSQQGSDRLLNLVFACRTCNERKADGTEEDFVASAWLTERRQRHRA